MDENNPKDPGNEPNGGPGKKPDKVKTRTIVLYAVLAVVLVALIASQVLTANNQATKPDELKTSDFVAAVNDDRMKEVTYHA